MNKASGGRKTFRCDEGTIRILERNAKKYNISEGECIRLAIQNMEQPGKYEMIAQLSNLCSLVNSVIEKSNVQNEVKNSLNEEVMAIWQQLK